MQSNSDRIMSSSSSKDDQMKELEVFIEQASVTDMAVKLLETLGTISNRISEVSAGIDQKYFSGTVLTEARKQPVDLKGFLAESLRVSQKMMAVGWGSLSELEDSLAVNGLVQDRKHETVAKG